MKTCAVLSYWEVASGWRSLWLMISSSVKF